MNNDKIQLEVITQEQHVLTKEVDKLTAPAVMGEVTILPKHIPLFTRLNDGIITFSLKDQVEELAILGGFMDVGPNGTVTILADAAIKSDDVNIAKAEAAKAAAQKAMEQKTSEVDFKIAESSLRKAMLELKVAKRHRSRQKP